VEKRDKKGATKPTGAKVVAGRQLRKKSPGYVVTTSFFRRTTFKSGQTKNRGSYVVVEPGKLEKVRIDPVGTGPEAIYRIPPTPETNLEHSAGTV
jgi:hypothetical protein